MRTLTIAIRTLCYPILAALMVMTLLLSSAQAACEKTSIDDNLEHGKILKMTNGGVYEVNGEDRNKTMDWLPTTDMMICQRPQRDYFGRTFFYYELINTDDEESASATKLR